MAAQDIKRTPGGAGRSVLVLKSNVVGSKPRAACIRTKLPTAILVSLSQGRPAPAETTENYLSLILKIPFQ